MSNNKRRCPSCGTMMPMEAKYCRKCQARMDPGSRRQASHAEQDADNQEGSREAAQRPRTRSYKGYTSEADSKPKANIGRLVAGLLLLAVVVAVVVVIAAKLSTAKLSEEEIQEESIAFEVPEEVTEAADTADAELADDADIAEDEAAEEEEAFERDVVYTISSGTNLRSGPGTTYDVVASLASGVALERVGITGNWSEVMYNGEVCYVNNTLVTTGDADEAEAETTTADTAETASSYTVTATDATTVYVLSEVNLRSGPGTGYSIVATVPAGTALTRTGTTGSWVQVEYNGETVYVFNTYVTDSTSDATVSTKSGTLTIASDANIRTGPGTSYDILGVAYVGETLTITGYTSTNWYQVEYNGSTGYVAGNMVTVD